MTETKKTAENYSTAEKLAMKGVPWPVAKQMQETALLQQRVAEATGLPAETKAKDEPTE